MWTLFMQCFFLWNKKSCTNFRGFTFSQKPIRNANLALKLIRQLFQPKRKPTTGNNNNNDSKWSEACLKPNQISKDKAFWENIHSRNLAVDYFWKKHPPGQCSDDASKTFYHFLDLRYSTLKEFLQLINIIEKIWSSIFKKLCVDN